MLHLFDISTAGHLSFPIDDGGKIKQIIQMEAGIFFWKRRIARVLCSQLNCPFWPRRKEMF